MIETFLQLGIQYPLVTIIALVGCSGLSILLLVVWREIFNMDFWGWE